LPQLWCLISGDKEYGSLCMVLIRTPHSHYNYCMNLYPSKFCEATDFKMPFKLKDSLDYFPLGLNQNTIATLLLNNFPWNLSDIHFVVLCSPILIPNTIEINKVTHIETYTNLWCYKWNLLTTTRIQSTNTQWKQKIWSQSHPLLIC